MFRAMFLDAWRQTRDQWIQWLLYAAMVVLLVVLAVFPINWLVEVFFPDNAMADIISEADKASIVWALIKTVVVSSVGGQIGVLLSLVMTAGQLPAMFRPGSIDLTVSYPHRRWKLLLARYLSGVVFVAWYAALLIGGVYVIAGIRGGSWDPKFLLCLPALLMMYCTLYSISLLVAVYFRNTVMVILGTLGVWFLAFVLNTTMSGFYNVSLRDYHRSQTEAYRRSQSEYARTQFMAQLLEAGEQQRRQQRQQARAAQGAGATGAGASGSTGSGGSTPGTADGSADPGADAGDRNAAGDSGGEGDTHAPAGKAMRTRDTVFADAQWYENAGDLARVPTFFLPKTAIYSKLFAEFSFEAETQNRVINGVEQWWKLLMQGKTLPPAHPDAMDLQCDERITAVTAKQMPDYWRDGGITAAFVLAMLLWAGWKFNRTDF